MLDVVLILAGQSNMAGRGDINQFAHHHVSTYTKQEQDHIHLWQHNSWKQAPAEPLHNDKPDKVGVGPGLAAALTLARAFSHLHIGLVPCAFGGSEINRWHPKYGGDLITALEQQVNAALDSNRAHAHCTTTPPLATTFTTSNTSNTPSTPSTPSTTTTTPSPTTTTSW